MSTAISMDKVTVAFQIEGSLQTALRDVHLRIEEGEFVALVGGNGSGKSTLLRLAAGLLPSSRGSIELPRHTRSALVSQNPDAQIIGTTVYEDVCFGMENMAVPHHEMDIRADQALASVGLLAYKHIEIEKLSGGQKQLLCIASALAMDATVILLDEPTSMLDPASKERVHVFLQQLHQQGHTVIMATQDMGEAAGAGRIIALHAGEVVYDGGPAAFFYGPHDQDTEEAPCISLGFRLPYSMEVVYHLRQSGIKLPEGKYPLTDEQCMKVVSDLCR